MRFSRTSHARTEASRWRVALPPACSFQPLQRPRLRSKSLPWGCGSKLGSVQRDNRLARRTAFLLCLVALNGGYRSIEQPGSSVMFYMQCFVRLASLGAVLTRYCCCSFGAPFKRPRWLLELGGPCTCTDQAHFRIEGTFSSQSLAAFEARCFPSSFAVFGARPSVGEAVSSFAARAPTRLVQRMASGSLWARDGSVPVLPLSAKHSTLQTLTLGGLVPLPPVSDVSCEPRPFHDDPEWIGELSDSLEFWELLRYRFKKHGHINILETRCYKTWLKWCSSRHPNSRLSGLIDSRVLLGASAKGRSNSPALSHVLQGIVC